jgi:uncharacterized protein with PIN domain
MTDKAHDALVNIGKGAQQLTIDYREGKREVFTDTIKLNDFMGYEQSFCPHCESEYTNTIRFEIVRGQDGVVHRDEILECLECREEYGIPGDF